MAFSSLAFENEAYLAFVDWRQCLILLWVHEIGLFWPFIYCIPPVYMGGDPFGRRFLMIPFCVLKKKIIKEA